MGGLVTPTPGGTPNGNGAAGAVGQTSSTDLTVNNAVNGSGGGGGGGNAVSDDDDFQVGDGNGGVGGTGVVMTGPNTLLSVQSGSSITGGHGGGGGGSSVTPTKGFYGGSAGNGGVGVVFTVPGSILNAGTIAGGGGGQRTSFGTFGGAETVRAGAGGAGIVGSNLSVTNSGLISGGVGGTDPDPGQLVGSGGVGIEGSNLSLNNTGGTISGGLDPLGNRAFALDVSGASFITGLGTMNGGVNVSSGTLTFDLSTNGTLSNVITGAAVNKSGSGTLTLSGANSYTGGTTFAAGTLNVGSAGALGTSGTLSFTGGILQYSASNQTDYSSRFSTAANQAYKIDTNGQSVSFATGLTSTGGSLDKSGSGALTLTTANTYTGATTISAGTLQIGNGGTTGSLGAGNVTNNATLAFNRSNAIIVANGISGTGAVNQIGAGTTVLTGANAYSGLTTINAGTLEIGDGGTSGTLGTGDVANNATLAFNRSDALTVTNAISGAGALQQVGTGTSILTGANTYTGTTSVEAGTLIVNGSIASSSGVVVNGGGTIGGTGTVSDLTVGSGGTVAAGNSIGTLNVVGNTTLNAGSIHQVEVAADGTSDLLSVSGTTAINGGTVDVITLDPDTSYVNGTRYRIVSSAGGVTGQFAAVQDDSAFLNFALAYDATNVFLNLSVVANFQSAAQTPNQQQIAGALQNLAQTGDELTLYNALLALNAQQAQTAFDLLSGEVHASAAHTFLATSRQLTGLVGERLWAVEANAGGTGNSGDVAMMGLGLSAEALHGRMALGADTSDDGAEPAARSPLAAWVRGYGDFASIDGNGNAAELDANAGGIMGGADLSILPGVTVGLMGQWGRTDGDVTSRLSSFDVDTGSVAAYAGLVHGAWRFKSMAGYSHHDIETERDIAFPGINRTALADYDADQVSLYGEAGYALQVGHVSIMPTAAVRYANTDVDDFAETGAAAANLVSNGETFDTLETILGVRLATSFASNGVTFIPQARIGWIHTSGDVTPELGLALQGGGDFIVGGVSQADNALAVGAGLNMTMDSHSSAFVDYTGNLSDEATAHAISGGLRIRF